MSLAFPKEPRSCQRSTEADTGSSSASSTLVGESASSSAVLDHGLLAPMRRGAPTAVAVADPLPSPPSSIASSDAAVRATFARHLPLTGPSEAARVAGPGG